MSRREQSAQRISAAAQALTLERGFDGFTMEDLAEAVGVSRRTLFNYFDSKLDAVLGPEPEFSEEVTSQFVSGGPTGHLFEDLGHLAHTHFARMPQERDQIAAMRQLIRNPRIMAACHARFEKLAQDGLVMIREREGTRYDELRAKVAIGMLLVLCKVALDEFTETADTRTFIDQYEATLSSARAVLA